MANKHIEEIKNDLFEEKEVSGNGVDKTDKSVILNDLLSGAIVIIPDFGYLEPKSLGGRQTVLFKSADSYDPVMQQSSDPSGAVNNISDSLKKGNSVSLPEIGIFRPVKKSDGSYTISFILSSFLRKKLNGEEIQNQEEVKETIKEESISDEAETKVETINRDEAANEEVAFVKPKPEIKVSTANVPKIAKKGDVIIPDDEVISKKKSNSGLILLITVCIAVLVIGFSIWFQNKKEEPPTSEIQSVKSINLPDLAEQNYGNPIFWVYIYEANQKKLTSPVNIPEGIELVIPDLSEYNVDVTDSMEIKRAWVKSDVILKQINSIINNN